MPLNLTPQQTVTSQLEQGQEFAMNITVMFSLLMHGLVFWWLWYEQPIELKPLASAPHSVIEMFEVQPQIVPTPTTASDSQEPQAVLDSVEAHTQGDEPVVQHHQPKRLVLPKKEAVRTASEITKNSQSQSVTVPKDNTPLPQAPMSASSQPTMASATVQTVATDSKPDMSWHNEYDAKVVAALKRCTRYPEEAREDALFGRVVVSFVMHRDGRSLQAQIVSPAHELLEQAAMEAIACLPRLPFPAKADTNSRSYRLPIAFYIE